MALTEAELRYKINSLTYKKNNCISTRDSYNNSLSYAIKLASSLRNSGTYIESAYNNLKQSFSIGNKTIDNGKLTAAKDDVSQIVRKLENTITPSIRTNIADLNTEINNLDWQIKDLERQLREVRTSENQTQ